MGMSPAKKEGLRTDFSSQGIYMSKSDAEQDGSANWRPHIGEEKEKKVRVSYTKKKLKMGKDPRDQPNFTKVPKPPEVEPCRENGEMKNERNLVLCHGKTVIPRYREAGGTGSPGVGGCEDQSIMVKGENRVEARRGRSGRGCGAGGTSGIR